MIELELFYNRAVVAVRSEQAEYLKEQKRVPLKYFLPVVEEKSAEELANLTKAERKLYSIDLRKAKKRLRKAKKEQKQPVEERLTKGYNAGIELALRVFSREFTAFMKYLEQRENE